MDKAELQRLKAELEARAQKELDAKLEEVNAYLMEQTRARQRLDQIRDANEMELRKEFENMRKELLVSCYLSVFDDNDDSLISVENILSAQNRDWFISVQ